MVCKSKHENSQRSSMCLNINLLNHLMNVSVSVVSFTYGNAVGYLHRQNSSLTEFTPSTSIGVFRGNKFVYLLPKCFITSSWARKAFAKISCMISYDERCLDFLLRMLHLN